MHSIHQQLSVTSWHSAMQLLSVQGETTNSVPSLLFLVVTAFPSSQGHLFNWFCKPLATKFTTAAEVGSTVTATGWEKAFPYITTAPKKQVLTRFL